MPSLRILYITFAYFISSYIKYFLNYHLSQAGIYKSYCWNSFLHIFFLYLKTAYFCPQDLVFPTSLFSGLRDGAGCVFRSVMNGVVCRRGLMGGAGVDAGGAGVDVGDAGDAGVDAGGAGADVGHAGVDAGGAGVDAGRDAENFRVAPASNAYVHYGCRLLPRNAPPKNDIFASQRDGLPGAGIYVKLTMVSQDI